MPEYRLKIIVEGEDRASNAVKQSSASLNDLVKKVQALAVVAGVAKLTHDLVQLGVEAAGVAARVREMTGVAQLLGQRAGLTADEVTKQIEAIKKLGITTEVSASLLAKFSKNNLDMAQATDLARVAQDAAVLSGEDSSQALAGLMHGIESYNVEVLRTRGLNVQMEKAFQDYAVTLGKTAAELTTAEKSQAALNAVLQEGENIAGTYEKAMEEPGKRVRSLARYHEEALNVIGGPFVGAMGAYADGMTGMYKVILDNEGAFQRLLKPLGDAAAGVIKFATSLGTMYLQARGARAALDLVDDKIVELSSHAERGAAHLTTFGRAWEAWRDVPQIQEDIAAKMERTAAAAAYMSRNVSGGFEEMRRLADEYATELERADQVAWQGVSGRAQAEQIRTAAQLRYNRAVWAYAQVNGVTTKTIYDLLAAEQAAMAAGHAAEEARYRKILADLAAARASRSLLAAIQLEVAGYTRVAAAADKAALAAGRYAGRIKLGGQLIARQEYIAKQVAAYDQAHPASGGGGGESPRVRWERERVDSARRAALEVKYWEQDQKEWIADNQAQLSAELQAEFAARTAAAQAEADQIKETDANLARELLDAESQYQRDKAAIAADEGLSDEERATKLAILDREQAETVARAKETAALEAQIREEERQRELAQARATGQATGQAMAEEFGRIFDGKMAAMQGKWADQERGAKQAAQNAQPEWDSFFGSLLPKQDTATSEWDATRDQAITAATLSKAAWDGFMTGLLKQQGLFVSGWGQIQPVPLPANQPLPSHQGGGSVNAPFGVPVPIIAHGGEEYRPKGHPPDRGGLTVNVYGNVVNSPASTDPGNIAWTIDSELAMRGVRV